MAVLYAPDSAYAQERVKHEAQYTPMGPGLRPYVKRDYPMMLHKAGRPENGMGADEIRESCVVDSERERARQEHEGFRATPLEALEAFAAQQFEIAELAAERNFHERRMSPKAQAEAEAANEAAGGHLAAVPVTPIRRQQHKGWPKGKPRAPRAQTAAPAAQE
jgi:hypothetical protein